MADIYPSIVLEDSRGKKMIFYYKDSSIYYRETTNGEAVKDTILISQANADFAAAVDADDIIYLACNSKYKGILLFTCSNSGWKFEQVISPHSSSNIYIMDIIVQDSYLHIFFSKKLPISNLYNVYHIHKDFNEQHPYPEFSWKKNSLSEIYSQNIESSYSILPAKGNAIHYASVWYDGNRYYINYYIYDGSIKSWLHKGLNISYRNQAYIKLLHHNKKIHLLCFSNDPGTSNIHHFISKSAGNNEIDFKELSRAYIDTGGIFPLFYTDDKYIQLAWIKDRVFHQYTFEDSSVKWKKTFDLPVASEANILAVKTVKHGSTAKRFYLLDKNCNLLRPDEHIPGINLEDKQPEKSQTALPSDINTYLKQILDSIESLNKNIRNLDDRIGTLEGRAYVKSGSEEEKKEITKSPKTDANSNSMYPALKKTNFKEKFMSITKPPNYESLKLKQDHITAYVGKEESASFSDGVRKENGADGISTGNDKQAFAPPARGVFGRNPKTSEKNGGIIKKIGEFFK